MIKGILFDKDGTLLDFNKTWLTPYFQASRFIAESAGKPEIADTLMIEGGYDIDSKKWRPDSLLASGSNDEIFEFWTRLTGRPLSAGQRAAVREIFSRAVRNYVPAVEDIGGCFKKLRAKNMKLGLATMDDELYANNMLEELNISGCFDFVCGADSGFGIKPDPGMVFAFCERCFLSPEQVCMVGDSPRDIKMGKNAGAGKTIGVLTGAHGRDELEPISDLVLNDIGEIEALLNS